jgi:hypothetical protein
MGKPWILIGVTLAMALTASADFFILNGGGLVEGSVLRTNANGSVTIKTKSGVQTYSVAEFTDETRDMHFAGVEIPVEAEATQQTQPAESRDPTGLLSMGARHVSGKHVAGLAIAGAVCLAIGGLWMIIAGFAESPLWGIAFLISGGIAELAFIFTHWHRAKTPLLIQILGVALLVGAMLASR